MGFASYHEDNLDARSEFIKGRHYHLTPSTKKTKKTQGITKSQFIRKGMPDFTHRPSPKQSPKTLRPKVLHSTRQDIRRRKSQKEQHVPVMKTQRVTTKEIQRRIQREIIRQSILNE